LAIVDRAHSEHQPAHQHESEEAVGVSKRKVSPTSQEAKDGPLQKRMRLGDPQDGWVGSAATETHGASVGQPSKAAQEVRSADDIEGSAREAIIAEAQRSSPSNTSANRRMVSEEERRRGKRLYGGLLITISRTNADSQQKRRQEIEQRQHDRAQQQSAEDQRRRAERLAWVERQRMIDQIAFDEHVVCVSFSFVGLESGRDRQD
jgi:hypothetical protein